MDLGKIEELGLKVILRDIHEVFGVLHGMLEELEEFFDGPQIIFCDMFFTSFSRWYSGFTPDLADGLGGLREFFQNADVFGAEAFVFVF